MEKGSRRDSRKRECSEDDELDPMDPSSYSDAPRGGWYVHLYGCSIYQKKKNLYYDVLSLSSLRFKFVVIGNFINDDLQGCRPKRGAASSS